jgi:hypothetical protein
MNRPTSIDPPMKQDDVYLHFKIYVLYKCYAQYYRKVEIEMLGRHKFIFQPLHIHLCKTC